MRAIDKTANKKEAKETQYFLPNLAMPTESQWNKIATAFLFSFISGFLATLTAQGGVQVGLGWEGVLALIGGCLVAGFNVATYTIYIIFFKKPEE